MVLYVNLMIPGYGSVNGQKWSKKGSKRAQMTKNGSVLGSENGPKRGPLYKAEIPRLVPQI